VTSRFQGSSRKPIGRPPLVCIPPDSRGALVDRAPCRPAARRRQELRCCDSAPLSAADVETNRALEGGAEVRRRDRLSRTIHPTPVFSPAFLWARPRFQRRKTRGAGRNRPTQRTRVPRRMAARRWSSTTIFSNPRQLVQNSGALSPTDSLTLQRTVRAGCSTASARENPRFRFAGQTSRDFRNTSQRREGKGTTSPPLPPHPFVAPSRP
jgi:hypothetical protein